MLTAPNETYVRERTTSKRTPRRGPRRDLVENFAALEDDGEYNSGRRRTGLRLSFHGGLSQSIWGRVAAISALLAILGVGWAAASVARHMVLQDERFVLAGAFSVLTEGNQHLSRAQLLQVFGGDIERNILSISLTERKADLEQIPWIKHATLMRLLPDRIKVSVEERTPVAFIRQGGHIGLVDADGVLLELAPGNSQSDGYSFPVVTGVSPADPVSVRAARIKVFQEFVKALDTTGQRISARLSEVDLSNPEDVKALIPDRGTDVLVHFGDSDYLDRYRKYEAHLAEWRAQYPKLSSVDMRYERQVVLEMQPGTAVPMAGSAPHPAEQQKNGKAISSPGSKIVSTKPHAAAQNAMQHPGGSTRKTSAKSLSPAAIKAGHP